MVRLGLASRPLHRPSLNGTLSKTDSLAISSFSEEQGTEVSSLVSFLRLPTSLPFLSQLRNHWFERCWRANRVSPVNPSAASSTGWSLDPFWRQKPASLLLWHGINPMVIVIDALDECDDKDLMAEFIEVIIDAFQENPRLPFRIFVTSGVEEHVRRKLETSAARSVIHYLSL
jgi:hypothetical protein